MLPYPLWNLTLPERNRDETSCDCERLELGSLFVPYWRLEAEQSIEPVLVSCSNYCSNDFCTSNRGRTFHSCVDSTVAVDSDGAENNCISHQLQLQLQLQLGVSFPLRID